MVYFFLIFQILINVRLRHLLARSTPGLEGSAGAPLLASPQATEAPGEAGLNADRESLTNSSDESSSPFGRIAP